MPAILRRPRSTSSVPARDLDTFLNATFFNIFIGNNDAHGKNFSLIYTGTTGLAPLYDLISTELCGSLSKEMAMSIGGEFMAPLLTASHLDQMADEIELSRSMVRKRFISLGKAILNSLAGIHPPVPALRKLTSKRVKQLIAQIE